MRQQQSAAAKLAAFEDKIRSDLQVPNGEDWTLYLPENSRGDRIFAEWQRLGAVARKAEGAR